MSLQYLKTSFGVLLAGFLTVGHSLWGEAPRAISVTADNVVYVSDQTNTTTLTGRAIDADGDLSHISFYINGPHKNYSEGWTIVGTDHGPSGYDATGTYVWAPPAPGTWHVHIRAYDSTGTVDSNANILNTFVAQSGLAPVTVSIAGEDIVYQSNGKATTTLTGRATDANEDLSHYNFYINGPDYTGWNYVGNDYDPSGGDAYGAYEWTPTRAGNWNIHFRAYDETGKVDSNADVTNTLKVRNATATYNDAEFVRYENLPYVMEPGETYNNVKVVMKNTGTKAWSSDTTPHKLGSRNPQDNTTWGLSRDAISANVSAGSEHTFSFNITAPSTAGEYNFQWRMVEDGVEWLGESTPPHTIVVERDYQTVHSRYPVGRDSDRDGWSNEGEARLGTSITSGNGDNALKAATLSSYWANQKDTSKSTEVGVLQGSFAVNQSGGAGYSLPLSLPKGTAGMEPELVLVYDSANLLDGPFGLGWRLSGGFVITRGPATRANNRTSDPVDYDANDQFYLNGKLLVAISGTYGASGTEYRTLVDEFSRVYSQGTAGSGPAYFKVETKNGLIFYYGNTTDSKVHGAAPRNVEVLNWHVNRIEDLNGNYIDFHYTDSSSSGEDLEQRLDKITYTGSVSPAVSPYYEVKFDYENYEAATATSGINPEEVTGFYIGRRVRHTKRVRSIKVNYTVGGSYEVWRYDLKYHTDLVSKKPLLKSVTQVSGTSSTEPISFAYGEESPGTFAQNVGVDTQLFYNASHNADGNRVDAADFDGDGLTDLLVTDGGSYWLYRSTGTGFSPIGSGILRAENGNTADTDAMKILDCNADGRSDMVAKFGSRIYFREWNTASNTWSTVAWTDSMSGFNGGSLTMDADQDGRQEVFTTVSNGWELWEVSGSTVSKIAHDTETGTFPSSSDVVLAMEYDDDGIPEILSTHGQGNWTGHRLSKFVLNGSGAITELRHLHQLTSPDTHTHDIIPADFNGDGLTDLLYYVKSTSPDVGAEDWYVNLSTGKGSGNYVNHSVGSGDLEKTEFALMDVDGNGTTDLVYAHESGSSIQWKYRLFKDNEFASAEDFSANLTFRGPILDGSTVTGDFNGDGKLDLAYQRDSTGTNNDDIYAHLFKKPYVLSNPLTKVTDALGASTRIEYAPLSSTRSEDSGFYTKGGTASGLVTMQFPYYAVKTVSVENGYSQEIETHYSYEGYRIDPFRGPVGFAKLKVRRPAFWHPIGGFLYQTDYSVFNQTYPYTGMVKESGTLSIAGAQLSKTEVTTFAKKDLNSRKTVFPYVQVSQVTGTDLDGTGLPRKVTETRYDDWGNATTVKVSNYASAAAGSHTHRTTNTNTYGTSADHKRLGRLNSSTVLYEKSGSTSITRKTSYNYHTSSNGYLLKDEITEPNNAALKLTKSYTYDGFGNVTGVSLSGSGSTVNSQNTGITTRTQVTTAYDSKGRFPTRSTNAKGHTEYYYYDGNDLKKGRRTRLKGANNRETKFEYDAFNRVAKTIANYAVPGGSRRVATTVTRGWAGGAYKPTGTVYFVETKTDGQAPSIVFYNKAGQEISKQEVLIDGSISRVETEYTPLAQAYRVTQPFKSTGSFSWSSPGTVPIIDMEFDEMGRPKWQVVPDPGHPDGAATYFEYNGLKSVVINPLGQKTRTTIDENGNTIKVENNFHLAASAADRSEVTYAYDAAGNLISSTDALSKVTTMSYDIRGRKTQMNDPNMGLWKYTYNVLGELIWQRDAVGNSSTVSYDTLGRITRRVDKTSANATEKTTQWTYDTATNGKGKVREIKYSDNSHKKTFTYNIYGDLTSRETTTDSKIVKETYSYDLKGRLTTTDYAFAGISKHLVKRDYSTNLGFIYRIQQDADASGSTYPYTTVWEANAMDAWGNHTTFTLGNGAKTVRQFSGENGYLESIRTAYGSDASNYIQDSTFVFDQIGNLAARSSGAGWGTSQAMEEFHYFDQLNRLLYTYVNGRQEEALQYDKVGNIKARYGVGQYVYDSTQPNAVDSIRDPLSIATLHSYTYNANGSMTSRAGKAITWTTFNKPHQVKNGTTVLSQFRYGFDRERIRQDTPDGDIYYFGGVEWSWNAASTSDTEARIYLNAPSGRVGVHLKDSSLAPSETRYFHTDHLGSIELVTNHFGEVIDRLSYSPWGQRRQDVWTHGNSFHKGVERRGFTGHEHLAYADFELIHMNGRVYDPVLARFVSADPFADGLSASQTLNRYAYVGNNPVSLTDPSGHFIGVILGFAFSHLTTSLTAKVVLGAVIGGLQAAISGGEWGDVLQGAVLGGVAAGIAHGIGEHFGHNPSVFDFGNEFGRALAHGLSQGGLSDVAGGNFGDGFLGGFFGSVGSSLMSSPGFGNTFDTRSSRLFASVVIGGTASELGGGKFGNGALSAAFVEMFNYEEGKGLTDNGEPEEKNLVIGIYGAGGENSGNNPTLKQLVEAMGGTMYGRNQKDVIITLIESNPKANVTIIGYSRGGLAAVDLANTLGAKEIQVQKLITFDPHSLVRNRLTLKYNNVGSAYNYYQQNPRTWGSFLPFGSTPYTGRPVTSEFINVRNVNYTGNRDVTHLNIITEVLAKEGN